MKFPLLHFVLLATAVSLNARPLDVYFLGNQTKVETLFSKSIDEQKYHFVKLTKQELSAPKQKTTGVIIIPKEVRIEQKVDKALVALIIDKHGKVIDVVISEVTDQRIIPSIKEYIVKWVFLPATKAGDAVASLIFAPLEFKTTTPIVNVPGSN